MYEWLCSLTEQSLLIMEQLYFVLYIAELTYLIALCVHLRMYCCTECIIIVVLLPNTLGNSSNISLANTTWTEKNDNKLSVRVYSLPFDVKVRTFPLIDNVFTVAEAYMINTLKCEWVCMCEFQMNVYMRFVCDVYALIMCICFHACTSMSKVERNWDL